VDFLWNAVRAGLGLVMLSFSMVCVLMDSMWISWHFYQKKKTKKMDEEVSNLHMHVWDGVASAVMEMFVDVC